MKVCKLIGYNAETDSMDSDILIPSEAILYSDTIPDNYEDITSVNSLEEGFLIGAYDYNKFRDSCKVNILPIFSALTSNDQKKMVSHYIYPSNYTQEEIDAFFNSEEQISNWINLAALCKDSRNKRWESARRRISFELTLVESLGFYLDTKSFKYDFIDANLPHLTLWLSNGTYAPLGIDYSSNGFAQKNYYTTDRMNICLDILINGNY